MSGRRLDLLVGPAGAGKTTAMRALRNAWTTTHGPDSVVGLAPSAAAADVLADDLGLACDNTAKWLHEHDHRRADFQPGQLVIVDEATLAGTLTLDRITTLAADVGAKVLLVGDWAQLQSVDAGGAFSMLAEARDDTPELTEVHRFTHDWERAASLDLRVGNNRAISTYVRHERVREGAGEDMREAAYTAWLEDLRTGHSSILVTESAHEVTALNERARADRIIDGETQPTREVELHDHTRASVGDLVITRRNDRRLSSPRGAWIHNGDRWRITDVLPDGTITVHRLGRAGGTVTLPAHYVAEHVELGYAVTAHRAQGLTVDTSHVVVTSATTRENLYVAMTRGSRSNLAYVALDDPDDSHAPPTDDEVTGATVLYGVLKHQGTELSAHQTIAAEQEHWSSFAQIAAEYLTLAAEAQRDRWINELQEAGLTPEQVDEVVTSDSFGPLTAELRRLEASGSDIATLLPRTVQARSLIDAEDIGAVLTKRLSRSTPRSRRVNRDPHLIAGLIPIATGPMPDDMTHALTERQELLEQRATSLTEDAVARRDPWTRRLGEPPRDAGAREHWMRHVRTVAAYRDRYDVDCSHPIGDGGVTDVQRLDAARARQAMRRALESAEDHRLLGQQPLGTPTLR